MIKLVGIREVIAVPSQKKVALVMGSQCKMQSVTYRVAGHDLVPDIGVNDFGDG